MAAIKTYAVLENDYTSQRNEGYSYFKFASLRELRQCPELNEHSIVFSTVDQLREAYTKEELASVMEATYIKDPKCEPLKQSTVGYLHTTDTHDQFFKFVEFIARKYKPVKKEEPMEVKASTPVVQIDQFNNKAQKHEETKKVERVARSKYEPTAQIVVTGANPYREGSNRWHNFEALRKASTVAEALSAMKALTPGGNSVDIKLALAKGAIKLED